MEGQAANVTAKSTGKEEVAELRSDKVGGGGRESSSGSEGEGSADDKPPPKGDKGQAKAGRRQLACDHSCTPDANGAPAQCPHTFGKHTPRNRHRESAHLHPQCHDECDGWQHILLSLRTLLLRPLPLRPSPSATPPPPPLHPFTCTKVPRGLLPVMTDDVWRYVQPSPPPAEPLSVPPPRGKRKRSAATGPALSARPVTSTQLYTAARHARITAAQLRNLPPLVAAPFLEAVTRVTDHVPLSVWRLPPLQSLDSQVAPHAPYSLDELLRTEHKLSSMALRPINLPDWDDSKEQGSRTLHSIYPSAYVLTDEALSEEYAWQEQQRRVGGVPGQPRQLLYLSDIDSFDGWGKVDTDKLGLLDPLSTSSTSSSSSSPSTPRLIDVRHYLNTNLISKDKRNLFALLEGDYKGIKTASCTSSRAAPSTACTWSSCSSRSITSATLAPACGTACCPSTGRCSTRTGCASWPSGAASKR